ncbi:M18 family aminopeptidase [Spongorhabdus nitratireducens]
MSFNQRLLDYLHASPTPWHATKNMQQLLQEAGFELLDERDEWSIQPGKGYVVTRNGSSLIAFTTGRAEYTKTGFRMVGAHTDSPCLQVKPAPEIKKHGYLQLGVETYGGVLLNPWFDRDLSLAGRVVYTDSNNQLKSTLINFEKAIATIPSLAIHLDRGANKERTVNPQTDIPPVLCHLPDDDTADFRSLLLKHLKEQGVAAEKVVDFDLRFFDTQAPAQIGLRDEFIASARLDNLLSCFVGTEALLNAGTDAEYPFLLVCNDHEECGSLSTTGAQGPFLKDVLERVIGSGADFTRTMQNSLLISADNAHGIHPNFADKHDSNHGPLLNAGPVIKINANQRYATTDETSSLFRWVCEMEGVPVQQFVTRTDMGCGSTIGPLTSGELGVRTLDVGLPTFGMHSIRELAGTKDAEYLVKVLKRLASMEQLVIS